MTSLTLIPAAPETRQTWEKRLSTWRSLRDDFNGHPAGRMLPNAPGYEASEADHDALSDVCSAGERLLMLTPAPDAAALLEKMDIWWETQGPHRDDREETFAAIRADVERLTTGNGR